MLFLIVEVNIQPSFVLGESLYLYIRFLVTTYRCFSLQLCTYVFNVLGITYSPKVIGTESRYLNGPSDLI